MSNNTKILLIIAYATGSEHLTLSGLYHTHYKYIYIYIPNWRNKKRAEGAVIAQINGSIVLVNALHDLNFLKGVSVPVGMKALIRCIS